MSDSQEGKSLKSLLHMHLDETKYCFGCGPSNPNGLYLEPYLKDEKTVVASYVTPKHLCSYQFKRDADNVRAPVHGGILCALLDCLGAWSFYHLRRKLLVTKEFQVQLLKPVFVGEKIHLQSEILSEHKNTIDVRGEIRNEQNTLCTVSRITYRVLSQELQKKFTAK